MSQKLTPITAPPSSTLARREPAAWHTATHDRRREQPDVQPLDVLQTEVPWKSAVELGFLRDQSKTRRAPMNPPMVSSSVNSGAVPK